MSRHIVAAIAIAAVLSTPLTGAQAGFLTDVATGKIKNTARLAKQSAKDVVALGRFVGPSVGRCLFKRATGRPC